MIVIRPVHRADVVEAARRWLGTPYHHQASSLGNGVDCIGLVRGVWRELYGSEPAVLPGYGLDWTEATASETLLEATRCHFVEVAAGSAGDGDVAVFRFRTRTVAKHVGILASTVEVRRPSMNGTDAEIGRTVVADRTTFIHATERLPVTEVALTRWWERRIAAVFRFPGIID